MTKSVNIKAGRVGRQERSAERERGAPAGKAFADGPSLPPSPWTGDRSPSGGRNDYDLETGSGAASGEGGRDGRRRFRLPGHVGELRQQAYLLGVPQPEAIPVRRARRAGAGRAYDLRPGGGVRAGGALDPRRVPGGEPWG